MHASVTLQADDRSRSSVTQEADFQCNLRTPNPQETARDSIDHFRLSIQRLRHGGIRRSVSLRYRRLDFNLGRMGDMVRKDTRTSLPRASASASGLMHQTRQLPAGSLSRCAQIAARANPLNPANGVCRARPNGASLEESSRESALPLLQKSATRGPYRILCPVPNELQSRGVPPFFQLRGSHVRPAAVKEVHQIAH